MPAVKTRHDYPRLLAEELADFRAFLRTLSLEQWDADTLCAGWRVRDVVGHMCVGYTTSVVALPVKLIPYGFSVKKGSFELSRRFGTENSPGEVLAVFNRETEKVKPGGLARVIPPHERFTDHLIHQQDIRRPLGRPREIPAARIAAAMDALPTIGGFLQSKRTCAGLRFVAVDSDCSVGDGPEVRGTGEALVLAMSGRAVVLPELTGDGVATLRDRIAG